MFQDESGGTAIEWYHCSPSLCVTGISWWMSFCDSSQHIYLALSHQCWMPTTYISHNPCHLQHLWWYHVSMSMKLSVNIAVYCKQKTLYQQMNSFHYSLAILCALFSSDCVNSWHCVGLSLYQVKDLSRQCDSVYKFP